MSENKSISVTGGNNPTLMASIAELKTHIPSQYQEQVYHKTLSDLAGTVFEPLAGLKVTWLPTLFPQGTFERPENSNLILSANYVEYLTGHQRVLLAAIEIMPGYVPFNVNGKAFDDALQHAVEYHLNLCGYTMAKTPPSGLRKVEHVQIGHNRLNRIFNPVATFREIHGAAPLGEKNAVKVDVSEASIITSARVGALKHLAGENAKLAHVNWMRHIPEMDEFQMLVIAEESTWLTSSQGPLRTQKVIFFKDSPKSIPVEYFPRANALVVENGVWILSVDRVENKYQVGEHGYFEIEGEVLRHIQPALMLTENDEGSLTLDRPEDWRLIRSDRVMDYQGEFKGLKLDDANRSMNLEELATLFQFVDKNFDNPERVSFYIPSAPKDSEVPVEVPVVESTPVLAPVEERILPWTFFDRLAMAWKAFTTRDPLKED